MNVEKVLREMDLFLADSPYIPDVEEWKSAIEAAMREPVGEVMQSTESKWVHLSRDLPVGTKLFAFPPDADAEIERLEHALEECKKYYELTLQERHRLREALDFYADPETYFGLMVLGDPPCGAFADDFSDDHGHPYLDGPRYGKTARAALAGEEETK